MRSIPLPAGRAEPRFRARTAYPLLAASALALSGISCGAAKMAPEMRAPQADMAAAEPMGREMAGDAAGEEAPAIQPGAVAMVQRAPKRAQATVVGRANAGDGEWAAVRQFSAPDYSAGANDGPRNDFRETVYWAPSVQTDASGQAQVSFFLSDAITSFRATAEGLSGSGLPGRGESLIASRLPISLAAKLPLEVTYGDTITLPVTVENTTRRWRKARVQADFGPAFRVRDRQASKPQTLSIGPGKSNTLYYSLQVVGRGQQTEHGRIALTATSGNLSDSLQRVVKVSPGGYPDEQALAGTLTHSVRHELTLPSVVPDTLEASLRFYPSPVSTMVEGTEALIREPSGCFEQASSSNYPNVMVMRYLATNNALESSLVARTQKTLDNGYKRLTGYESKERGFEWFGQNPGHEALTAYGLMQFSEMAHVYPDLDPTMVERTRNWLKSRRDGEGGYQRNSKALDTFGRASKEVTDAYITYALAKSGDRDLTKELARASSLAAKSSDPYVLALSAGALVHADPKSADGNTALERLASLQHSDGSFKGARETITRSGGVSMEIETTALAALAMMQSQSRQKYAQTVNKGVDWMISRRSGGRFGATQSTVLAMEALTAHARNFGRGVPGAALEITINGTRLPAVALAQGGDEGIAVPEIASHLRAGKNVIEIAAKLADGQEISLPYEFHTRYRVGNGTSSKEAAVRIATKLSAKRTRMGRPVRLDAEIKNLRAEGLPMVIGRIGIPGGLSYQVWQLDELRERGVIDFYETREREVIVYFRDMAPKEVKKVQLQLLASVPGRYVSPESSAYLYYTDEYRHYAAPTRLQIKTPWRASKKKSSKPSSTSPRASK